MESEAVNMRIDAYNAVNQNIRPARFLKLRQQLRHHRLVTSLRFLTQPRHIRQPGQQ